MESPHQSLVIVESPAKCKKIASYLGPGFSVVATMGHIRSLEEDLSAIGLDRDFEPRYTFLKEKSKTLATLQKAAAGVKTIYLAADDDREGEAIAYSVALFLKKDPTALPRIVFHEITPTAIRAAVAAPRRIDMNKVYAQQTRAMLDMMIGFTISPILWKRIGPSLSAGRCQTPALRIVCERETAIQSHTSDMTWTLKTELSPQSKTVPESKPASKLPFTLVEELEDQTSAMNYMENVYTSNKATVNCVKEGVWSLSAPAPLITSTLQQEASALFHFAPKQTMRIAQGLYEGGAITYMRTDSVTMSEDAKREGRAWVLAKHGLSYVEPSEGGAVAVATVTKGKKKAVAAAAAAQEAVPKAQEAHECIRPTHMDAPTLTGAGAGAAAGQQEKWNEQDHKLYGLIWRRAVQSLMSAARGKRRTVTATLEGDADEFQWSSTVSKTDFEGWKILGATAQLDAEDDEDATDGKEAAWTLAASLTQGAALTWAAIQAQPTYTRAKPRFTEATLVRELEGKGIGRPSTFASLLETLQDKGYVEKKTIAGTQVQTTTLLLHPNEWPPSKQSGTKTLGAEKDKLVPTPLGHSVATFCSTEFPGLFAYSFTAEMEAGLDSIAKGDLPWKQLCNKTWDSYKDVYTAQKAQKGGTANSAKLRDFGGGLKAILSKKGALIVQEAQTEGGKPTFYPFPEGATLQNITEEQVRAAIATKQTAQVGSNDYGALDGEPIVKKKGPYGFYVEWKGLRCPVVEGEPRDAVLGKLQARLLTKDKDHTVGPYTFRVGQYGPYMYKTALKQRKFVGIPADTRVALLTEQMADQLYKEGLNQKKGSARRAAAAAADA